MSSVSLAPYAWSYELANVMNPDGSYGHWSQPVLSFTEPNVPEGSIRNLTPLYVWPATSTPDWEAIKNKRMCDLTPAQQEDARELWLREQVGWLGEYHRSWCEFLLKRLDEARAALTEQPAAQAEPSNRDTLLCDRACVVTGRCTGSCRANSVSALPQPSTSAPQGVQAEPLPGFVLVPKEPTLGMMRAGLEGLGSCVGSCGEASPPELSDVAYAYGAMLAAAPAAPAQEPQQSDPNDIRETLYRIEQTLTVPAAEYVPAIGDVFDIIQRARKDLDRAAASSPAPAVQPTEAVAELVQALRGAFDALSQPRVFPADVDLAKQIMTAAIAKHGQPQPNAPRFTMTYCSQCGQELGPGNSGVSHCSEHVISGGRNG